MKRICYALLAAALCLSLCAPAFAAEPVAVVDPTEFSDAKDIQYWPAVATLAKLGVIDGKDNGSFDPAGNVTRAEAAKLIAVIMNGGGEVNAAVKAEPTFTDIQGHWAEGYIEYCADMNIVNGAGDGTFGPDGQVSVLQMYKMALTALGYDWVVYQLAGSRWAERVLDCARKADGRKLTEGLANNGMDGTGADQPATREMVAQILYNALQAITIEIVPDKNTSGGEIVWAYLPSSITLLQVRFGLDDLPTVPAQPTL